MVVFSAVLLMLASGAQAQDARTLDDFESTDGWKVVASDQVGGALRVVDGASVSTSNRSIGTYRAASLICTAFLNVTMPENEM